MFSGRIRQILRKGILACVLCSMLTAMGACGAGTGSTGKVTISFFQTKSEANETYGKIIKDFEKENPNITVVQNSVAASPETALRALLVKGRTPDVIAINPNGNIGRIAKNGVFYDFSKNPLMNEIQPSMQKVVNVLGTHGKTESNLLSYTGNVDGIMYNVDIFNKYDVKVPTTWKELEETVAKLESNGVTPFIGTLGDSDRIATQWDGLAPYYTQNGFWNKMRQEGSDVGPESQVSMQKDMYPLMQRLQWIFSHAQKNVRNTTYEDGNAAFARGEGAMLMTGSWGMAPIQAVNPKIKVRVFPYPTDDVKNTILVSGPDQGITMGVKPKHEKESLKFIRYLFTPKVQQYFVDQQKCIPSLKKVKVHNNMMLESVMPYVLKGNIEGYADHQLPNSINYNSVLNQAMLDGDLRGALVELDHEWAKYQARTIQ